MNSDRTKELGEHLTALTMQMQSGVAFTEQVEWEEAGIPRHIARELKHLRVGINNVFSICAALADLLEAKGIATTDEYLSACINRMQAEVDGYQRRVVKKFGLNARLGEAGFGDIEE